MTITRFTQRSLYLLLVMAMVGCAEQPTNRNFRYSSISWLRIDEQDSLLPDESPDAQERQLKTHTQLIKSYSVLDAALGKPGIAELPGVMNAQESGIDVTDWLDKRVQVIVGDDPDTKIMQIQVSSDDSNEAQQLCEAVTDVYLERVVSEGRKGLLKRRDLLEKVYNRKAEEVRRKREDYHDLCRKLGTTDVKLVNAAAQVLLMDHVLELRKLASAIHRERLNKEHALRHKKEGDQGIGNLGIEIASLKRQYKAIISEYEELSVDIRQLGEFAADLVRRNEELAHLVKLTLSLGMELELLEFKLLEERADRVRLIQKAHLPKAQ